MAIGRHGFAVAGLAAALLIGAAAVSADGFEAAAAGSGTGKDEEPGGGGAAGAGEETGTGEQEVDVAELERRIDLLADELELLRSGETVEAVSVDEARALGLAPSAAATYGIDSGVSIAGYGEMLYENYASDKTSQFDFLRAILYAGYRFNDRFLFNSEIEVEHAKEIFVEFAYLDYLATDNVGLRAGMLLIPMGLVNEFHEPTVFLGAERPVTEKSIIPSTWRENGGGVYGAFDNVAFRAYVVNGLNGSAFSSSGVRGGARRAARPRRTTWRSPAGWTSRRRRGSSSAPASTPADRDRATSSWTSATTACAPASSTCTRRRRSAVSISAPCSPGRASTTRRC